MAADSGLVRGRNASSAPKIFRATAVGSDEVLAPTESDLRPGELTVAGKNSGLKDSILERVLTFSTEDAQKGLSSASICV
jgi:hypothetical protein